MLNFRLMRRSFTSCLLPFVIVFLLITMYTTVIIYMYNPELADILNDYQEAMPQMMSAVGMTGIASNLIEWIQIYLYGFIMRLFPLIFIVVMVNKLVMGYIDRGAMACLLATPNSRKKIICTQIISMILYLIFCMVCVTAVGILSSEAMFPGELDISKYIALNVGTLMLWVAQAGIAFFFACLFSDSKYYYIFGGGIPVLFFFLQMLANMGGDLEFLKYFTIESLLKTEELTAGKSEAFLFCGILGLLGLLLCTAGGIHFTKRDLPL